MIAFAIGLDEPFIEPSPQEWYFPDDDEFHGIEMSHTMIDESHEGDSEQCLASMIAGHIIQSEPHAISATLTELRDDDNE